MTQEYDKNMEELREEIKELSRYIDSRLEKANEKMINNSTHISNLEGKFMGNSALFTYLNDEISRIRQELKIFDSQFRALKHEYNELRESVFGESKIGESKTIVERLETNVSKMEMIGKKIEGLQENYNVSVTRLSLLEDEKEKIKRIVNEYTTKTIYELAAINAYQSMRGFIRVRFGKIRSSVSTVASKLFHSVLFRIIMALVTLSLSAPIFEELRKIIEQILIDLNIAN
jgi:chromosome segregation ATPase